jgi:hypothetical protein
LRSARNMYGDLTGGYCSVKLLAPFELLAPLA